MSEFDHITLERFAATVALIKQNGCWIWPGSSSSSGYGRVTNANRRNVSVHRVSYAYFKGPIPAGLYVLHRCDTKMCVNPDHLELGTHADNMRQASERCLNARGERQGAAKLTESAVREIRRLYAEGGISQRALAKRFGIEQGTIWPMLTGKTWTHVH